MTAGLMACSSAPLPASLGRLVIYTMARPMITVAKGTIRAPGAFVPTSWPVGRWGLGLPLSRVHWAIRSPPEGGVTRGKIPRPEETNRSPRQSGNLSRERESGRAHTCDELAGRAELRKWRLPQGREGGSSRAPKYVQTHCSMPQIRWLSRAISDEQLPSQGWQRPVWPRWGRPCNHTADGRTASSQRGGGPTRDAS